MFWGCLCLFCHGAGCVCVCVRCCRSHVPVAPVDMSIPGQYLIASSVTPTPLSYKNKYFLCLLVETQIITAVVGRQALFLPLFFFLCFISSVDRIRPNIGTHQNSSRCFQGSLLIVVVSPDHGGPGCLYLNFSSWAQLGILRVEDINSKNKTNNRCTVLITLSRVQELVPR